MKRILDFVKINNRLIIEVDDRKELEELIADGGTFLDAIEYQRCNGWELLNAEQVGALISDDCTLLSDDVEIDDSGNVTDREYTLYYDNNYAVRDPLSALARDGKIVLYPVVPTGF